MQELFNKLYGDITQIKKFKKKLANWLKIYYIRAWQIKTHILTYPILIPRREEKQ
jgi:hypothetical protein